MKEEKVKKWAKYLLGKAVEAWNKNDFDNADNFKAEAYGTMQCLVILYPDKEKEIASYWDKWESRYYGFD